jgi:recombinational DNA repair ATPase RecF
MVSGFRGIGQAATLAVAPSPGLTLVVGRNGSGKSSFAEALEVLLTGNLRRWEKLPAVWRQGWRSVHYPDHTQITAEFLMEGAGLARSAKDLAGGGGLHRRFGVGASGRREAGGH